MEHPTFERAQSGPLANHFNVEDLFLAGVTFGGMHTHKWFIENSRVHASMIVDYITSK
ncbi:hypothetical protein [Flavobacterium lipolyticum]|uniref:Uncharacterized protein n=1 Tax=Flavobacterium lipolyticum TaxID=2893754 RepID=A0ABS8M5J5_9FLAO|nr:hypothetical protein [Flavobacterium sp. F-126]MCC9020088.1 hypothetical protein [Flavobacterium sp. F-126]